MYAAAIHDTVGMPPFRPRRKEPSRTVSYTEQMSDPSLANRYGAPKRKFSRRFKFIAAAIVLAVVLAGLAVYGATLGNPPIDSKTIGYDTVDATLTTVDFKLTKDREATVKCAVEAVNSEYAIVGWTVVTVGPATAAEGSNGGKTTGHHVSVRTESLASSGDVQACWVADDAA